MNDARELCDMLDGIKQRMQENVGADGICRFNVQHMKWILQLAEKILVESIDPPQAE